MSELESAKAAAASTGAASTGAASTSAEASASIHSAAERSAADPSADGPSTASTADPAEAPRWNVITELVRRLARFTTRVQALCETATLATREGGDYRLRLKPAAEPSFLHPLGERTAAEHERFFQELTAGAAAERTEPIAHGRSLRLRACPRGVAKLSFVSLCDRPLGAADYIALAQRFHTLFLTDVPQLSLRDRDKARRFITLVDQLYNHRVRLISTAEVPISELFTGSAGGAPVPIDLEGLEFEGEAGKIDELNPIGVTANALPSDGVGGLARTGRVAADSRKQLVHDSLFTGEDEAFAFRRAISRLMEMQSQQYLSMHAATRG